MNDPSAHWSTIQLAILELVKAEREDAAKRQRERDARIVRMSDTNTLDEIAAAIERDGGGKP